MTWLFSRAMVAACENSRCSPEREEYSAASCSDGEPSAPLNVMPTQHKFLRNGKTIESSNLSRFGLTCVVLTADRGAALLMSYRAAFPAKTSARQVLVPASAEREAASGSTWIGSFARLNRDTSTWKTAQCSLLGGLDEYSETWPRWGAMRNGACYLRPTSAPVISANESGFWQTPVADDAMNRAIGKWNSRGEPKLSAQVMFSTPCAIDARPITGGNLYQTATGTVRHMRPDGKSSNRGLQAQVLWPTVNGNHNRAGASPTSGDGLSTAVKKLPTPVASASKGSSPASLVRRSGKSRENDRIDHAVMASDGGQLNPEWVEWLMGWPIGWTALKPLAMDRFQEWRQQHGKS